ncbi:hypothetical protein [Legionella worsleiensis]|uniref:Transmembrane protein n=1 Tax=Legionella worsleiensis TaxID=45076 RepID=A0A0W1AJ63_9GAMM|nr:hypothetical protein [Legionella worsleiensis]KTD81389.1 hypothetical protein Lwor_0666 [Legionella worsleiensis]STY30031.1 Uncharacterised protein [Legionella worsleiensis]
MTSLTKAWQSYIACRSILWWPLSFLLLTPLATLIVFGFIIPLGLEQFGLITFNHPVLNFMYLSLAGILIFFSIVPWLDGLYKTIFSYLNGEEIDENTGFRELHDAKNTGIGLFVMIIITALASSLIVFFKFLKLPLFLITYPCILFTPLLIVTNNASPIFAWRDSIKLALNNWRLTLKIFGVRVLTILSLYVPIVLMIWSAHLPRVFFVFFILIMSVILVHNIIKLVPFYFFYPAYEFKNHLSSSDSF